jgi:hypothetical protein
MDPDTRTSGFHRSIVLKAGLASRDVLASGQGRAAPAAEPPAAPVEPSLARIGISMEAPRVRGLTSAGVETAFRIPFTITDRKKLPEGVQASIRWDPIEVSIVPADPATEVDPAPSAEPAASPAPETSPAPEASAPPAGSPEPAASTEPGDTSPPPSLPNPLVASPGPGTVGAQGSPAPSPEVERDQPVVPPIDIPLVPGAPPDLVLVQPERLGAVVEPVAGKWQKTGILFPLTLPGDPGLYRMTVTLHDADGVAFDAATQALVPSMLVRIVGEFDAKVLATPTTTLEAGTNVPLPIRVANLGKAEWGRTVVQRRPGGVIAPTAAKVVGHWIALDPAVDMTLAPVTADLPSGLAGGKTADAELQLAVPVRPGAYLLVLDVVTPEHGSLAGLGVAPTIVHVTVLPAP